MKIQSKVDRVIVSTIAQSMPIGVLVSFSETA
jgi:hypothetical protein